MKSRSTRPGLLAAFLAAGTGIACALPQATGQASTTSPTFDTQVMLPAVPPGPVILRVRITPLAPLAGHAVMLHPQLRLQAQLTGVVRLAPWSLYPPDQTAEFVLRVPPDLLAAARRGDRLVLSVEVVPLHPEAAAAASMPGKAPGIAMQAEWGPLRTP